MLLDTTALIDVSRGREPATSWLAAEVQHPVQLSVSVITIAEFYTALRPDRRSEWQDFFARLTQRNVTRQIAMRAGAFRYDLAQQGRSLTLADALIAATAVEYEIPLVTASIKDFAWLNLDVVPPGT